MKRLQRCCYCAKTRTGALAVAALCAAAAVLGVIGEWTSPLDEVLDFFNPGVSKVVTTINSLLALTISVLLIFGVQKGRSVLVLPWLALGPLQVAVVLYMGLNRGAVSLIEGHDADAAAKIVGSLVGLCVYVYLWGVVFSHYLDVRDEEKRGRYSEGAGAQARNAA